LVKPLHHLEEISGRLSQVDGNGVRLVHVVDGGELKVFHGGVEPAAATKQALAAPIDFPPLAAGIVPGDRLAVAVESAVPGLRGVVRGAIDSLLEAGVEPADISIVVEDEPTAEAVREEVAAETGTKVVVHSATDENNLCLVGTMKRGEPLLVNKAIFDADVVLPIGCARVGAASAYEALFPRFSNAVMLEKYRSPAQREAVAYRIGKQSEVDEAGWMIGVQMIIQVVPSASEEVAYVLAGEPQSVARRGEEMCREQWLWQSPQRVGLVIATVTGDSLAQTWANVGRALAAAESVLDEEGAIAICSNLDDKPGHSIGRLIDCGDLDLAARKIFRDHDADSWPAWYLARALQRGPVYLMSQLNSDTVEDLGVAPVESIDELVRLVGRNESFMVIDDAQHAVVVLNDDGDERD
jgi:nickel-dependent lactate racemase